jgi:hypothetical protein
MERRLTLCDISDQSDKGLARSRDASFGRLCRFGRTPPRTFREQTFKHCHDIDSWLKAGCP